ncbi:hypothetical protein AOQ84DRAFT_369675 [Glonium stellatum]|uniref:Uncharacterized protein n=1 Tax=Glonium stellatum TaxID=574774 RepID=A0A8E2ENY3_9PEZI|nr:hypothetical protein AOQ84DRAFT_369675 [Glonium stellatum]
MPQPLRVHACLEAAGLRTSGKHSASDQETKMVHRKPKFDFKPVSDLYYNKVAYLSHKLSEGGDVYDRLDRFLFDTELEQILKDSGPTIWPESTERQHLLVADPSTRYQRDLFYPQDKDVLKERLRDLVLARKTGNRYSLDGSSLSQGHNTARPNGSNGTDINSAGSPGGGMSRQDSGDGRLKRIKVNSNAVDRNDQELWENSLETEDASSRGTVHRPPAKHQQQRLSKERHASRPEGSDNVTGQAQDRSDISVEKIYKSQIHIFSKAWSAYGSMDLKGCTSVDQFFEKLSSTIYKNRATQEGNHEINWVEIELPEDMSCEQSLLLKRCDDDIDTKFHHLKDILSSAPVFFGKIGRILEAEVAFVDENSDCSMED